jgi:hypothetical protein
VCKKLLLRLRMHVIWLLPMICLFIFIFQIFIYKALRDEQGYNYLHEIQQRQLYVPAGARVLGDKYHLLPTTCLCSLCTTQDPRYQPHHTFCVSSIYCDVNLSGYIIYIILATTYNTNLHLGYLHLYLMSWLSIHNFISATVLPFSPQAR